MPTASVVVSQRSPLEMGRMFDYRQARRTSAERSAELRPNVVCHHETMSFTGERTERPENVAVSKHVNTHASSEMTNYVEKLQRIVYEQSN